MRKEIIFAILAGIIIGVVIAFGAWRANSAINTNDTLVDNDDTSLEESVPAEEDQQLNIVISNLENDDVLTASPVKIVGLTRPNLIIGVSTENEDNIFKSSDDGSFEFDVDLLGGLNRIKVYAFDENGNSVSKEIRLIYSTEFLADIESEEEL